MIGICTFSAFSAVVIHGIEYGINNKAITSYNYDGKEGRKTKNTIHYNKKGEAYFNKYGRRFYLDYFQRVEA